jgi:monoterpene epsilon-lactone hydrolase
VIILAGAVFVGLVLVLLAYLFTRDSLSKYDLPEGQRFSPADATAVAASAAAVKALNKRLRGASGPSVFSPCVKPWILFLPVQKPLVL